MHETLLQCCQYMLRTDQRGVSDLSTGGLERHLSVELGLMLKSTGT